jgi:tRNA(adenine34) deaminase
MRGPSNWTIDLKANRSVRSLPEADMTHPFPDKWMARALELARQASLAGEVPIGAVLVLPDGATFEGRNRSEEISPLHHAEMEALAAALGERTRHQLGNSILYVTAEPCLMCLGAMVQARVGGLVYGCGEPRFGGVEVLRNLWHQGRYPHHFPISSGLLEEESRALLQEFFERRRM